MKLRHWNNIVDSLRHRRCVLVLGPEIPADASQSDQVQAGEIVSGSTALKRQLMQELEDENLEVTATSLAGVAQQYEDARDLGPMLKTQAAKFYESGPLAPSAMHGAIARLPFELILTTCHDRLLATALEQAGKKPLDPYYNFRGDLRESPKFALPCSVQAPLVYHLFGHCRNPMSMVLSENDLLDFLIAVISEQPPLPNNLRRALQQGGNSFLFVGFGICDWYLRVLLKALVKDLTRDMSSNQMASAFALEPSLQCIPDIERQQTILFYQRGTRVEICQEEIFDFIARLNKEMDKLSEGDEQPTLPMQRPQVFISYASEDRVVAAQLSESLVQAGMDPWLDKNALQGGEDWNEKIEEQLREADYVLVLQTPHLAAKRVGYVNKEIDFARDRARYVRGAFLIPLQVNDLAPENSLEELAKYQQMALRETCYEQDVARLVSTIRRDYQLRRR
jgi:hypothetical protein